MQEKNQLIIKKIPDDILTTAIQIVLCRLFLVDSLEVEFRWLNKNASRNL